MDRSRRALLALAATLPWVPARAQDPWPSRPITMLVPSTPGGVVDIAARHVQPGLTEALRTSVVVENRPGGGGHIAASAVARATPDGYTLLCSAGSILISGVVRKLNYSPMSDLAPVARVTSGSFLVLVPANSPYKNLADLIAHGKANPGKLLYASTSVGNSTHIGAEMLSQLTGMKATHVPYKGNVPALMDLAASRVDFSLDSRSPALPFIRSGQIRPLAVTAATRDSDFPELPAVAEQVEGYGLEGWVGIFAPGKTPAAIVERIAEAVSRTLADPVLAQRMSEGGAMAAFMGPAEVGRFMRMDHERISKVVQTAGISLD
jgi:tripartite-type tricarboxylate transporter receptor subunit TctC